MYGRIEKDKADLNGTIQKSLFFDNYDMVSGNPGARFGESAKAKFPRATQLQWIIKLGFFSLRNGSMQETGSDPKPILDYLPDKRGFDFSRRFRETRILHYFCFL
jgi:hypothetical protein